MYEQGSPKARYCKSAWTIGGTRRWDTGREGIITRRGRAIGIWPRRTGKRRCLPMLGSCSCIANSRSLTAEAGIGMAIRVVPYEVGMTYYVWLETPGPKGSHAQCRNMTSC